MLHSAGTIPKTISGGTFISSDFYSDNITFENNMRGVNGTFTPYANTKKNLELPQIGIFQMQMTKKKSAEFR
ncbi:MAG: hypothetical protein ACJAQ1_001647 [Flavobacterium sp.]|jgi:hypothetical protein